MHQNSVEAYLAVKPTLDQKYEEIISYFKKHGELSRNDVYEIRKTENPDSLVSWAGNLSARIAEMKNMDILEPCGTKKNPKTNKPNEVLRLTGRAPKPYTPVSPYKQRYEETMAELDKVREENAHLWNLLNIATEARA